MSRSFWDKLGVPRSSGVYFLLRNGIIVYIGRSTDLGKCMRTHPLGRYVRSGQWTLECYPVPFEEPVQLEREWIALIEPEHNDNFISKETRRLRRPLVQRRKAFYARKLGVVNARV